MIWDIGQHKFAREQQHSGRRNNKIECRFELQIAHKVMSDGANSRGESNNKQGISGGLLGFNVKQINQNGDSQNSAATANES